MKQAMNSGVIKRSFYAGGRKSSVTLEDEFWHSLRSIAAEEEISVSHLIHMIDQQRISTNLSSSIRVFVLEHYRFLAKTRKELIL